MVWLNDAVEDDNDDGVAMVRLLLKLFAILFCRLCKQLARWLSAYWTQTRRGSATAEDMVESHAKVISVFMMTRLTVARRKVGKNLSQNEIFKL